MQHCGKKKQAKSSTILKRNKKTAESIVKSIASSQTVVRDLIKSKNMGKMDLIAGDYLLTKALFDIGMTPELVAKKLFELLDWETEKVDKNGNVYHVKDGNLRYKAIDLWAKITGSNKTGKEEHHNHLHLERLPDDKLDALLGKTS